MFTARYGLSHYITQILFVFVLCYKSEGRWFDPSWCHWNFSLTLKSFRSHYGPRVDAASKRNEYQEYILEGEGGRRVRLTTLLPSCAVVTKSGNLNFLKTSGPLQACNGTDLLYVSSLKFNTIFKKLNTREIPAHQISIYAPLLAIR